MEPDWRRNVVESSSLYQIIVCLEHLLPISVVETVLLNFCLFVFDVLDFFLMYDVLLTQYIILYPPQFYLSYSYICLPIIKIRISFLNFFLSLLFF